METVLKKMSCSFCKRNIERAPTSTMDGQPLNIAMRLVVWSSDADLTLIWSWPDHEAGNPAPPPLLHLLRHRPLRAHLRDQGHCLRQSGQGQNRENGNVQNNTFAVIFFFFASIVWIVNCRSHCGIAAWCIKSQIERWDGVEVFRRCWAVFSRRTTAAAPAETTMLLNARWWWWWWWW